MKNRIKTKMPWSVFALFVSSSIVIGGLYLNHFYRTQTQTLEHVLDVRSRMTGIETKQALIMYHFKNEDDAGTYLGNPFNGYDVGGFP